jgi:hypothetical protein
MDITITIPDAVATDVRDAICERYFYELKKLEGETKLQFSKRMLAAHIKEIYVDYMGTQAANAARATSNTTTQAVNIT